MTALRLLIALPLAALAACVPPAPEPTPAPSPAPDPDPTRAPPQEITPTYDDWMDAPQTAGDWSYAPSATGGVARFGQPQSEPRFSFACNRPTGSVTLIRAGSSPSAIPMRIRTETADRTLSVEPDGTGLPTLAATLPARDSFLDAIAFSKGRFAVEVRGLETLYLPAWPEISRVIEDCR